jgi:hypothetical protein
MARDTDRQHPANLAKTSSSPPKDDVSSNVLSKRAQHFPAVSPDEPAPRRSPARHLVLPLVFLSVLTVFMAKTPGVRLVLPIALMALAIAIRSATARRRSSHRRGILIDHASLYFQADGNEPRSVVSLRDPFGLTLVKSPERDRIVAVWSSPEGLFYVGTSLDEETTRLLGPLFDRAFTVLGDDAALQAIGPDGKVLELSSSDFLALILAVEEIDPACHRRLILSDARGAPFRLDARELVVGERRFDLEAPLEWRPFVFQEALGQSVTVFQGTSIRQGGSEAVLVSLLPSFVPFEVRDSGQFDRAMLRDLRLVQASPEDPPPRDARVAIDRLFVLPVRSALDTAPHANRRSSRARA